MNEIKDYIGQIICGDNLEVMKGMPSNSIDLVVTSPPYNVGIEYDVWKDNLILEEYYDWCRKWLTEIYRLLKEDGRFCLNHYLSCGRGTDGYTVDNRHAPLMNLNTISESIGFKHHGLAVWTDITITKRTAWGSWMSASAPYINSPYEGILILYKNKWKKLSEGVSTINKDMFMKLCTGIWDMPTDKERLTMATFPTKLPEYCINLLSYKDDIVLDPFSGSGTTCLIAEKLHRRWIGIEISEKYVEIAKNRVQNEVNQFKLFEI